MPQTDTQRCSCAYYRPCQIALCARCEDPLIPVIPAYQAVSAVRITRVSLFQACCGVTSRRLGVVNAWG
jgi:hypothetical protein